MNFKKIFFPVTFFAILLFSISSVAETISEEQFQKGVKAYKKGDHITAFKLWKPLAEQGDASSQYNLAGMYLFGDGVKSDEYEAAKWYLEAAKQGHEKSEFNLRQGCSEGYKVFCESYKLYRASLVKGKY